MDILTAATWNVRGLYTKESELLEIKPINITIITKTKMRLKETKVIKNFVMIYCGVLET